MERSLNWMEKNMSSNLIKLVLNPVVDVYCDKCKSKFKISSSNIKANDKGKMRYTYFRCPECNRAYVVSILNDKKLDELRHDLFQTRMRYEKSIKGNDRKLEQTLKEMVSIKAHRLSEYSNKLRAEISQDENL